MNNLNKKKIAIAEADQLLKNIIRSHLEKNGADVLYADDFVELENITFNHRPDLIVTDIHINGQDLLKFMKDLRLDNWGKNANLFILTDHRLDKDEYFLQELSSIKPTYILHKDDNEMDEVIDRIIEVVS